MAYPTVRCGTCFTVLAKNPGVPVDEGMICPVCGGKTRNYAMAIASAIRLSANVEEPRVSVHVSRAQPPEVENAKTARLRRDGYRLDWSELTETGAWWVKVYRGDELIDSGAGLDPKDALLAVIETLLPLRSPSLSS